MKRPSAVVIDFKTRQKYKKKIVTGKMRRAAKMAMVVAQYITPSSGRAK